MSIEYSIIAMNNAVKKEIVLKAFDPYCTKINDEEYSLDYGDEVYENQVISNSCTLMLSLNEENEQIVESIEILRPCVGTELEKALFLLIHEYPMFFAAPDFPIMTANQQCMDLLEAEDPDTFEDVTLVSSFDEFSDLLCC